MGHPGPAALPSSPFSAQDFDRPRPGCASARTFPTRRGMPCSGTAGRSARSTRSAAASMPRRPGCATFVNMPRRKEPTSAIPPPDPGRLSWRWDESWPAAAAVVAGLGDRRPQGRGRCCTLSCARAFRPVEKSAWLDQNWKPPAREWYHHTNQGGQFPPMINVPYDPVPWRWRSRTCRSATPGRSPTRPISTGSAPSPRVPRRAPTTGGTARSPRRDRTTHSGPAHAGLAASPAGGLHLHRPGSRSDAPAGRQAVAQSGDGRDNECHRVELLRACPHGPADLQGHPAPDRRRLGDDRHRQAEPGDRRVAVPRTGDPLRFNRFALRTAARGPRCERRLARRCGPSSIPCMDGSARSGALGQEGEAAGRGGGLPDGSTP